MTRVAFPWAIRIGGRTMTMERLPRADAALGDALGFEVTSFVRTAEGLAAVLRAPGTLGANDDGERPTARKLGRMLAGKETDDGE